ncbi:MAG: hypothetical protein IKN43_10605 [Selenomonadaceae bacterium]|nr:hypothetical protein [Selenomonadaceae bacterium]
MLTSEYEVEQELEDILSKKGIRNMDESRREGLKALIELKYLLNQEEKDDLGRVMEDIERSKLTLYDDLRARYERNS